MLDLKGGIRTARDAWTEAEGLHNMLTAKQKILMTKNITDRQAYDAALGAMSNVSAKFQQAIERDHIFMSKLMNPSSHLVPLQELLGGTTVMGGTAPGVGSTGGGILKKILVPGSLNPGGDDVEYIPYANAAADTAFDTFLANLEFVLNTTAWMGVGQSKSFDFDKVMDSVADSVRNASAMRIAFAIQGPLARMRPYIDFINNTELGGKLVANVFRTQASDVMTACQVLGNMKMSPWAWMMVGGFGQRDYYGGTRDVFSFPQPVDSTVKNLSNWLRDKKAVFQEMCELERLMRYEQVRKAYDVISAVGMWTSESPWASLPSCVALGDLDPIYSNGFQFAPPKTLPMDVRSLPYQLIRNDWEDLRYVISQSGGSTAQRDDRSAQDLFQKVKGIGRRVIHIHNDNAPFIIDPMDDLKVMMAGIRPYSAGVKAWTDPFGFDGPAGYKIFTCPIEVQMDTLADLLAVDVDRLRSLAAAGGMPHLFDTTGKPVVSQCYATERTMQAADTSAFALLDGKPSHVGVFQTGGWSNKDGPRYSKNATLPVVVGLYDTDLAQPALTNSWDDFALSAVSRLIPNFSLNKQKYMGILESLKTPFVSKRDRVKGAEPVIDNRPAPMDADGVGDEPG
jgi:hypothetical protein